MEILSLALARRIRPAVSVVPAVSAVSIAIYASLLSGCKSGDDNGQAGKVVSAEVGVDKEIRNREARKQTDKQPSQFEERFSAEIEEHISSVPEPVLLMPRTDASAQTGLEPQAIRDRLVALMRSVAAGDARIVCDLPRASEEAQPFHVIVLMFRGGQERGVGEARGVGLCAAVVTATRRAIAANGGPLAKTDDVRFAIDIPTHGISLVEFQERGLELSDGVLVTRELDKGRIEDSISAATAYLLRSMDPTYGGVHKFYYPSSDSREPQLHTIYTASTIFTLLKIYARSPEPELRAHIDRAAAFLMRMQEGASERRNFGAFAYSFDLKSKQAEQRWVVGTSAKSIYTLILLHELSGEARYRTAAMHAADWLLTMQQRSGRVHASLQWTRNGDWRVSDKESILYTGQVLSALARMYRATEEQRYLNGAARTAEYLLHKIGREGCYLGDDYRKPNPISSSWAVLSLFDFFLATGDARSERVVFECADELLGRQIQAKRADGVDSAEAMRVGRWQRALSSSGNGWLAEVMAELYVYCRKSAGADGAHVAGDLPAKGSGRAVAAISKGRRGDCARYRRAIVDVFRLLMQHTYTAESTFMVRNPAAAIGGVFWSARKRYVRTDAVCHAMNAYLMMVEYLDDGPLVALPESSLRL